MCGCLTLQRKSMCPPNCSYDGKDHDVVVRIQQRRWGKFKVVHVDRLKSYVGEEIKPWVCPCSGEVTESPLTAETITPQEEVLEVKVFMMSLSLLTVSQSLQGKTSVQKDQT